MDGVANVTVQQVHSIRRGVKNLRRSRSIK